MGLVVYKDAKKLYFISLEETMDVDGHEIDRLAFSTDAPIFCKEKKNK